MDTALNALRSVQMDFVAADYRIFAEERYLHKMLLQEHWIVGPEPRQFTASVVTDGA